MARFYGTVQGQRGEATRLGHSGLTVTAQSWSGDIHVNMFPDGQDEDYDWVTITARPHSGGSTVTLYSGRIAPLLSPQGHDRLVLEMAERGLARDAARAAAVTRR